MASVHCPRLDLLCNEDNSTLIGITFCDIQRYIKSTAIRKRMKLAQILSLLFKTGTNPRISISIDGQSFPAWQILKKNITRTGSRRRSGNSFVNSKNELPSWKIPTTGLKIKRTKASTRCKVGHFSTSLLKSQQRRQALL